MKYLFIRSYVNSNAQQLHEARGCLSGHGRNRTFLSLWNVPMGTADIHPLFGLRQEHWAHISAKNQVIWRRSPVLSSQNKPTGPCWSKPKAIIKGHTHHTQSKPGPQRKQGRGRAEGVEKAFTDPPTPSVYRRTPRSVSRSVGEAGHPHAPICASGVCWTRADPPIRAQSHGSHPVATFSNPSSRLRNRPWCRLTCFLALITSSSQESAGEGEA